MTGLVLDASAGLAVVLGEPAGRVIAPLLGGATALAAPAHWPIEVANALLMSERRGRIGEAAVREALTVFDDLAVEVEEAGASTTWTTTLTLARRHRLTLYDAAYLELALRRRLPLATLDAELRAAAAQEGVAALP